VRRINRQPLEGTEVVTSYELEAICRQDVEERIRTTMISAIRNAAMSLVAVYSEDVAASERVEITADVTVTGRADARLEKIVTKIGLEPGVFAVSWRVVPTSDDERELLPDA
jgi:putative Mg2+ transporter-C (MgtC) family protein